MLQISGFPTRESDRELCIIYTRYNRTELFLFRVIQILESVIGLQIVCENLPLNFLETFEINNVLTNKYIFTLEIIYIDF